MDNDLIKELLENDSDTEDLTEKQARIVEAAIEIFAKKGFAATSTKEIAQRAEVAEGTIFRHYATKKELLLSVIGPVVQKLLAPFIIKDMAKVMDVPFDNFEEFLYAMLKNRVAFIKRNLPILKILLQEIPFHAELKTLFIEHIGTKIYQRLKQLLQNYQDKGEIIEIPTDSAIRLMVSAGIGSLLIPLLFMPDLDWNEEREIERTVDFIMYGLAQR